MTSDDPDNPEQRFVIGDDDVPRAPEPGPGKSDQAAPGAEAPAAASQAPPSAPEPAPARTGCHIIAFAAGRGGTGKSLLAANVAIYLAQLGKRVIAVDADPAGGSLHQLLGTQRPLRGYGEFLRGATDSVSDLIVDTPVAGVGLVAGEGHAFASTSARQTPEAAVAAIRQLDVDYVVMDLGPPDSPLCVDLWLAAETPILVTLPDPASIDATYRFVKSAFVRRLRNIHGFERLLGDLRGAPPSALDLYRSAAAQAPRPRQAEPDGEVTRLCEEIAAYRPRFIVSQTRSLADLKLGIWMASAAHRRLGHPMAYLGHVESDEAVWVAARRHRPLVAEYPESKVAKNIERIVRRLLAMEGERAHHPPAPPRLEEEQTHYEILETEPGVSDEEIRRAFRRVKEIYADGSPAIAGLYDDRQLQELHARANAAHDVLFAPERRRGYDLGLPEADLARAVRAAAKLGVPRAVDRHEASEPIVEPEGDLTGPVMRKIRESRGIDLAEIAQRTKISERHLRYIEEERFGDMPAAVYVRGFVMQYARALRIDPNRAAAHYLRRYHEVREG